MDISQFHLHARVEDRHWWFRARREIIFEQFRKYLPPATDRLVAEIGCGTGGNLKFLQDHYRVVGVDLSAEAVGYAAQRVAGPVCQGDFRTELAGRWPEVDGVLLADVLEHVPDDREFLRDLLDLLRPGGMVVLTVPAHPFLWSHHDLVLGHLRRYTAPTFRALWQGLPVEQLTFSPFNCLLFPIIALVRLVGGGRGAVGQSDLQLPLPGVNWLLYRLFSLERLLLRGMPLPWGVSYLAVLRKR